MNGWLGKYARRLTALSLVAGCWYMARLPQISPEERTTLASHFHFTRYALPELKGYEYKTMRPVHPAYKNIQGWISAVGAAVAMCDLDGSGMARDIAWVDTRINQVIVAPAPGTPQRYQPFVLNPAPLPYDPNTMAPMGVLPGDFNEDGQLDLLVYYWGRTPIIFLRVFSQNCSGRSGNQFAFMPVEAAPPGVAGQIWNTNAATQADVDGDGHLDIIIGNYFPDGSRILDEHADGQVYMQHSMSRAFNGGTKHILLWQPSPKHEVNYRDVTDCFDEKTSHGWTLAIGANDLDGDMLPEIYFSNDFGPDRLLHNESTPGHLKFSLLKGIKHFTTPNSKVLGRDSFKGMGCDFADLNGDGLPDIYVSNIAAEFSLEESHFLWMSTGETQRMKDGVAPYEDQSEMLGLSRSGWGWDTRLDDYDNDGVYEAQQAVGFLHGETNRWPELQELATGSNLLLDKPHAWLNVRAGDELSSNHNNPFFVRASNGRYYDLAEEIGIGGPTVSRGIATGDVDGDGRLDFAVANQWATSYFYHNDSPNVGAYLSLDLRLPAGQGNRAAIGAEATVFLPNGRRSVRQVDGGNGHSGKRSPVLHFGLGHIDPSVPLKVSVRWRDTGGVVRTGEYQLTPGRHQVILGTKAR